MHFFLPFVLLFFSLFGEPLLIENLKKAQRGDYVVAEIGKMATLLRVVSNDSQNMKLEEISFPSPYKPKNYDSFLMDGAPGNTSWITFDIDIKRGALKNYYSLTRGCALSISKAENFLSTLLNLDLNPVPRDKMKKIGARGGSTLWQPPLYWKGEKIEGIFFQEWRTVWPVDATELSGKKISVYLPEPGSPYPAYFPYWLEISDILGKAKVRILDTGNNLSSPTDEQL